MGPYRGGQAQYIRIPYADFNALILPPGKEHESDFILLADIFPTGTLHIDQCSRPTIAYPGARLAWGGNLRLPVWRVRRCLWCWTCRSHGRLLCRDPWC